MQMQGQIGCMHQVTYISSNDAQDAAARGVVALKDGVCMGICTLASAVDLPHNPLPDQRGL